MSERIAAAVSGDLASVVDEARRSLVAVHHRRGSGAGTVWHPKGLIVTNAHVARSSSLEVTLPDGRRVPARLLARDPQRDLAVLTVDAGELPAIRLGDSRLLRPGEIVIAAGHPWGVSGASVAGVVVGAAEGWAGCPFPELEWVAARLELRPGHSGGPLVDAEGRLVGINTMINGPHLAFAVPVNAAKAFVKLVLEDRAGVQSVQHPEPWRRAA